MPFRFLTRVLVSGSIASLSSALTAALCAYAQGRKPTAPLNAVSHIWRGGPPGRYARHPGHNTWIGYALHHGASVFWALMYEALRGRAKARATTGEVLTKGAATALTAYVVDYHVVGKRFQPGFEAGQSRSSMFAVYAALAVGFAASTLFSRR